MKIPGCLLMILLLCCDVGADEYEVTYEVFSLPMSEAARMRRSKLAGNEVHSKILELLEKKAAKQKRYVVVKLMEDRPVEMEAVEEMIYPVEVVPSGFSLSHFVGLEPRIVPPFPLLPEIWAFDIQKLGMTLELELKKVNDELRLEMSANEVACLQIDHLGKEPFPVTMPRFSVQSLKTEAVVTPGKTVLVGSISPPRDLQKEGEKRVWLAFVTLVKEKGEN